MAPFDPGPLPERPRPNRPERCWLCEGTGRQKVFGFGCMGAVRVTEEVCWACDGTGEHRPEQ